MADSSGKGEGNEVGAVVDPDYEFLVDGRWVRASKVRDPLWRSNGPDGARAWRIQMVSSQNTKDGCDDA